jgi:protein subunit release factor B
MKKLIIEIHANEGGEDARDLVRLQADIYRKVASRRGL